MENIEYANSLYQVSEILKCLTPRMKARIPNKFLLYFENQKSKKFHWNLEESVPLDKQDLLPTTKEILTVLYRDYICDDTERADLDKTLRANEKTYQEELRKQYNPDTIFQNRSSATTATERPVANIVVFKKSLFSKFMSGLRSIFHR